MDHVLILPVGTEAGARPGDPGRRVAASLLGAKLRLFEGVQSAHGVVLR